MLPTNLLLDGIATAIAADTVALNAGDIAVRLIKDAFTPSPTLVLADLTAADFGGATDRGCDSPTWGYDPATGNRVIRAGNPTGGWNYETTNTSNLPQTIFGYCWFNTDNDDLFATVLLDEPIVLTAANQAFDIPPCTITMTPAAFV